MDRPYRKGYPCAEARDMIRALSGTSLDPQVVQVFLAVVPDGPLPSSEDLGSHSDLSAAEKELSISLLGTLPGVGLSVETIS
jgi:putative two-component system response regulator